MFYWDIYDLHKKKTVPLAIQTSMQRSKANLTTLSLPNRYADCLFTCIKSTCSFPLKTYNLQPLFGFLASGGSLYFNTTPLKVLVSAARAPEFAKLGFDASIASADGDGERDDCLLLLFPNFLPSGTPAAANADDCEGRAPPDRPALLLRPPSLRLSSSS